MMSSDLSPMCNRCFYETNFATSLHVHVLFTLELRAPPCGKISLNNIENGRQTSNFSVTGIPSI